MNAESSIMEVNRGDIYYVAGAEVTGSEQAGERPAIVVSNNIGNRYAPVVEIVYLTTKKKAEMPTHVYIGTAERPSIAVCEQIATVCKSRLLRYIGSVSEQEMNHIDKALSTSLGIHKTGGNDMQITMRTPFGEMNYNMPPEKVSDLMQRAFQYATGPSGEKLQHKTPTAAQEPEQPRPTERPQRCVDNIPEISEQQNNPEEETKHGTEEYKGFLLIKCKHCGKVKGFCTKSTIRQHICECGKETELHDLKPMFMDCKCSHKYKYMTNITDERFEYNCLNCGSPVDLELNSRKNTYISIKD